MIINGQKYFWRAVKVQSSDEACWWLSGNRYNNNLTLEHLISRHLEHALAEDENVWIATEWKKL